MLVHLCVDASKKCNELIFSVGNNQYNPYDIRRNKVGDSLTDIILNTYYYLASPDVRGKLEVKSKYLPASDNVFKNFELTGDRLRQWHVAVSEIINENIAVLV